MSPQVSLASFSHFLCPSDLSGSLCQSLSCLLGHNYLVTNRLPPWQCLICGVAAERSADEIHRAVLLLGQFIEAYLLHYHGCLISLLSLIVRFLRLCADWWQGPLQHDHPPPTAQTNVSLHCQRTLYFRYMRFVPGMMDQNYFLSVHKAIIPF